MMPLPILRPTATIALLTLRETIRRKVLLAAVIFTPIIVAASGWGFSKLTTLTESSGQPAAPSEIALNEAVFVILLGFMFSVVLALGATFLAAGSISGDVESGLFLSILPRPIRRAEVVLGKWLGIVIPLAAFVIGAAALELWVINLACGYVPPDPVGAVAYFIGESVIVVTLTILVSTRLPAMACGIIIVVLFGAAWIAGIVEKIGLGFHNTGLANAGTVVGLIMPSDGLWRGAAHALAPAAILAANVSENPFAADTPTVPFMIWSAIWLVAVLGGAIWSFGRREL
jgi:ABC-type transport system involved in multi-copper enzyme maturation permease subunit